MKRWLIEKLIEWDTTSEPFVYGPEDELNLGQLYADDVYKSLKKVFANLKYQSLKDSISTGDIDHARGQYLAVTKIENTLKRYNEKYKRKSKS